MIKAELKGIHHSVKNLQLYLDEWFNRIKSFKGIFHNLTCRMITYELVF